ncbi:Potassium voltage-gated channel sub C member 4 [Branchiostoma belcheri]|nr:Potassium voltage-gated channel sub C member 4 [Branchiostoma belcheri]
MLLSVVKTEDKIRPVPVGSSLASDGRFKPGLYLTILNYYRTGKLHYPSEVCGPLFEEELAFWGIDERQIEPCCWMSYQDSVRRRYSPRTDALRLPTFLHVDSTQKHQHRDAQETITAFEGSDHEDDETGLSAEIARRFGIEECLDSDQKSFWQRWQPKVWKFLEEPYSSKYARALAFTSLAFVMMAISIFCLGTHSYFLTEVNHTVQTVSDGNTTARTNNTVLVTARPLVYLEMLCCAWFTLEFFSRLAFCPDKLAFIKSLLNIVDFLSFFPFFVELSLSFMATHAAEESIRFLGMVRLARIFRIFKLTRHFTGLKILAYTLRASARELLLLMVFLGIGVLVYGSLIYYAEQTAKHDHNKFTSIPQSFWWAVVTMTTLGYGDMVPRTFAGMIVGTLCAVTGVLVVALPVPVIVSNFNLYYSHAQAMLKLPKKRHRALCGAAEALNQSSGTGNSNSSTRSRRNDSDKNTVSTIQTKVTCINEVLNGDPVILRSSSLIGRNGAANRKRSMRRSGIAPVPKIDGLVNGLGMSAASRSLVEASFQYGSVVPGALSSVYLLTARGWGRLTEWQEVKKAGREREDDAQPASPQTSPTSPNVPYNSALSASCWVPQLACNAASLQLEFIAKPTHQQTWVKTCPPGGGEKVGGFRQVAPAGLPPSLSRPRPGYTADRMSHQQHGTVSGRRHPVGTADRADSPVPWGPGRQPPARRLSSLGVPSTRPREHESLLPRGVHGNLTDM